MKKKLEKVKEYLENHPSVRLTYIFGSHATGKTTPLSDVDIAVYLKEENEEKRFDIRLKLIGDISSILGNDEFDLVVINDNPILLNFEIIKNGKILVNKDEDSRVEFEFRTMQTYLDRIYYVRRRLNTFAENVSKGGFFE